MLRFLLELRDLCIIVSHNDTEAAGLLHRNRHNGDGHIGIVCLVEVEHHFVIHFIDMVSGKD